MGRDRDLFFALCLVAGFCSASCRSAPELPAVAIDRVVPDSGVAGAATPVRIEGRFHLRVESDLDQATWRAEIAATVGGIALEQLVVTSENVIEGVVPGTLALGSHNMTVALPHGREGSKAAAFTVERACVTRAECDDGDPCTTSEQCVNQRCHFGAADKDSDGDGFVDASCGGGDCDDDVSQCGAGCYPGNLRPDICDGRDQDCDASVDEDPELTWFRDEDGDSFGDAASAIAACSAPPGYVSNGSDCDDNLAACGAGCFPGNPAPDICDGRNQDCDASVDENPNLLWYRDADGDSFGDAASAIAACPAPPGYVSNSSDCDDNPAACGAGCFPGNSAPDICDGRNQDCDALVDENPNLLWYPDGDGDGYTNNNNALPACMDPDGGSSGWLGTPTAHDCDDSDAQEYPGRIWYPDADGDGYGDAKSPGNPCERLFPGDRLNHSDCDDTQASVFPGTSCSDGQSCTVSDTCTTAGVCRGYNTCSGQCAGNCQSGCGGSGTCCIQTCPGGSCPDCPPGCSCDYFCTSGSLCTTTCQAGSICHLSVGGIDSSAATCVGATCFVRCSSENNCTLDCDAASICYVACSGVDICRLNCPSGATSCAGDVKVCNRPCP